MAAEKAAARERFRALRASTPSAQAAAVSAAIVARARALPDIEAARVVHLFWPLPGEVDLRALASALAAEGRTVALPVVTGRSLVHRRFEGADRLVAGAFGTMAPAADARAVAPGEIDVVLVPGLAAGRDGSRLGYGGGYYDRFLAETAALRVGVVPAAALVDALPTAPHDARLQLILTESETIRTRP